MRRLLSGALNSIWVWVSITLSLSVVRCHNLGEHGLSGASPTGLPALPAIDGPFTVELHAVEFQSLRPPSAQYLYQTIFEYSNESGTSTIWFGQHRQSDELSFYLTQGDDQTYCFQRGADSIVPGVPMKLSFGVDNQSNKMWIRKNGVLVVECSTTIQLADNQEPRLHRVLGAGGGFWAVDPLVGSIAGVRVTNLDIDAPHSMSQIQFQNLPGQMFGKGFVASFYARFDDIDEGVRSYQRIFDFGNGPGVLDNVWCGQESTGNNMACELHDNDSTPHRIVAQGAIVQGEFAFWHFGVDADGTFWIEKDGTVLVRERKSALPANVFRRQLKLAKAQEGNHDGLSGVVLGLRVDSVRIS